MNRLIRAAMATAVLGTVLAACGGETQTTERSQVRIVGSSTVYPFTTAVSEQLSRSGSGSAPLVESTGTGGGIQLFCAGVGLATPDVVNASRRMKRSEFDACAANGVTEIVEIQVGLDGLVLAHAKEATDFNLTLQQLYLALAANPLGAESNSAQTWADISPDLPAERIEVIGPPPTSGTRDSFNELMMEAGCSQFEEMKALKASDPDAYKAVCTKIREDGPFTEAGENDNLIVQKLATNPNALGAFGYSFLEENLDKLKGVAIDGVVPDYEAISSFQYPAARAMFIYVKAAHAKLGTPLSDNLNAFLAEYVKDSTFGPMGMLSQRGLIPSPEAERNAARTAALNLSLLDGSAL